MAPMTNGLDLGYPTWALPASCFARGAGRRWRRQFKYLITGRWK